MTGAIEEIKQQAISDFELNKFPEAIEGFEHCIDYYSEIGDELSTAEMRNNLSVALLKTRDFEKAFQIILNTDLVFAKHGDKKRQAMALANTAAALESLNKKEEALNYYERSLEIFKEIGEKEMRAEILRRVSDLQLKTKRGLQAIASLEAAYNQKDQKSLKESFFTTILSNIRKKIIK